jgi:FkbM family methyltransferase
MSLTSTLRFILNHPLNRERRLRAIARFVKWQIGSRLVPGAVLVPWVNGAKLIVRPGETGVTQNIYCGLHDFQEMLYVLHVLSSEDLFVDVGANVGIYTVLACAGADARGYCFEPVPDTFSRLVENLTINHLTSRVTARNVGLSDADGELSFTVSQNCTNHVLAPQEAGPNSLKVRVHSLDGLLSGEAPSFLKIDVEGYETPVLRGALGTLNHPALCSILIELNGSGTRYGYSDEGVIRILMDAGFSPFEYDPTSRELRPLPGANQHGNNTLFLRKLDTIREKLSRAPRLRIGPYEF